MFDSQARVEHTVQTAFEINLWEVPEESQGPKSITAPLDPADHGVDPLTYL